MKMKEKFKRFRSMDVHNHEGFTLVELIIVIAILAILSSVAVAGYSSYIEKANKQADMTLAAQIEQALWLAYYDQALGQDVAIVVVYADKNAKAVMSDGTTVSAAGEAAMAAAFGENWKETLRLQYGGWTTTAASVDMSLIDSSSFSSDKHLDELTERVSSLSGVLATYFGNGVTYVPVKEYMNANGIVSDDPQVQANIAVLQAANAITATNKEEFIELYSSGYAPLDLADYLTGNLGLDDVSAYAVAYAQMEGTLNFVEAKVIAGDDPTEIATFNELKATWVEDSSRLTGLADTKTLLQNTDNALAASFANYYMEYATGTQPAADAEAFLSYMGGMDEVAPSLTENLSDMASADYYKGNTVSDMLHTFIAASTVLGSNDGSAIVITFNGVDKVSILPMSDK